MRKRIFIFGMAVFTFLFCLAGCGQSNEAGQEKTEITRAGAVEYDSSLITVGFIQTGKESAWRDANTADFLNTFTVEKGYNLIYIDGNSDSDRQIKAAFDLIAQEVDYIIIDPIVENGWKDVLTEASAKNIPVIVSDRQVNLNASNYACWVGSDFYQEGVNGAGWLENYLVSQDKDREKIKIVLIEGTKGATATIGRTEGIMERLEKNPNWEIVARECGNFTQGEGTNVMKKILEEGIEFDVLITENDNMMFGAMKAMDQKEIKYGRGTDIITISFDALGEALDLVQTGKLMVSVECNPLIAQLAEKAIQKLEEGKRVEKVNFVEEMVFTYENVGAYRKDRKY